MSQTYIIFKIIKINIYPELDENILGNYKFTTQLKRHVTLPVNICLSFRGAWADMHFRFWQMTSPEKQLHWLHPMTNEVPWAEKKNRRNTLIKWTFIKWYIRCQKWKDLRVALKLDYIALFSPPHWLYFCYLKK